jgi:glutathione S-transferase
MLRLHDYSGSGNCYKVRLLLAQLERPYERVPVDIFGGDTLTDDFARLNPARETPVLESDEGPPLPQSNAILVHLAEGTDFLPGDPAERAQVLRWLFFEQAEVIPGIAGLRFRLITGRLEPDSPAVQNRRAVGEAALGVLNGHLGEHEFVGAEGYTVADISLYAYVHVAHEAGHDLADYPAVQAWIGRVEGTPRHMNDLEPYGSNAWPGAGRSIYG